MERTEKESQKLAVNTQEEVESLLIKILKANSILSNFGQDNESPVGGGLLKGSIRTSTSIDLSLPAIMENMMKFQVRRKVVFQDRISFSREYGGAPSQEEVEFLYDELDKKESMMKDKFNRQIDRMVNEEKRRVRAFEQKVAEIREGVNERNEEKVKNAVEELSERELKSEIDMQIIYETAEAFLEPCRKVQQGEFKEDEKEIAAQLEREILEALENAKVAKVVVFNPLSGKGVYGSKKHEPVHLYKGQINPEVIARELCRNAA